MKYELFFFKENNRILDLEELFSFFNYCPYITIKEANDEVEAKYYNQDIDLQASFHITKVSKVPDIYRLNPKYLDLDIYLSLDPMMPLYKVSIIMDLVSDLCQKFNFFIYNILFEDVTQYRKELVLKSYEMLRARYKEKFPMEYTSLNYVNEEKINDVLKYLYEKKDLENYYHNENLYFPTPFFIKAKSDGGIYLACNLVLDEHFVFPPQTDIIFFKNEDKVMTILYEELEKEIEKYTHDLPGFLHNTKVLDKAGVKKLKKILTKTKFSEINEIFSNVELETIIDFK